MRDKWDKRFMEMAELVASWSRDPSTKTGAVLVRSDNSVASVGFNGFPRGMDDNEELYLDREIKYSRIVHCEINAQLHCHECLNGYTLYTWPFLSCDRCAVQMIQAGIVRMVAPRNDAERWQEAFKRTRAFCAEAGVELLEL